jgi:hypothetical protein
MLYKIISVALVISLTINLFWMLIDGIKEYYKYNDDEEEES